ncbi:MAG: hypothetical protein EGR36_09145 [Eubacterium ventriosum]|uniref:hypothetical protein n=1 Tax=Eubacterium ventriosum TaxID=39496 RepID=UPI001DB1C450|nr:hypothetical protein [Eubacterium ventriosum]MBD9056131.1 hypothetical protein [Eubacterium ventriosum]
MSERKNKTPGTAKDNNALYILIFTVVVVIGIAVFIFSKNNSSKNDTNNAGAVANNNAGTTVLSVVETNGSLDGEIGEDETIDNYVNFFGDSSKKATAKDSIFDKNINQVKKFESKRSITLDNPSEASADSSDKGDTYTYLTYKFNGEKSPAVLGIPVNTDSNTCMLVYVFKNKELTEIRVQYGEVGMDHYNNLINTLTNTYGQASFSRSWSDGSKESWWKSKAYTLDAVCQKDAITLYYKVN